MNINGPTVPRVSQPVYPPAQIPPPQPIAFQVQPPVMHEIQLLASSRDTWASRVKFFCSLMIFFAVFDLFFNSLEVLQGSERLEVVSSLLMDMIIVMTGSFGIKAAKKKDTKSTRRYFHMITMLAGVYVFIVGISMMSFDLYISSIPTSQPQHQPANEEQEAQNTERKLQAYYEERFYMQQSNNSEPQFTYYSKTSNNIGWSPGSDNWNMVEPESTWGKPESPWGKPESAWGKSGSAWVKPENTWDQPDSSSDPFWPKPDFQHGWDVGYSYGSIPNTPAWENPFDVPQKADDEQWQYGKNGDWEWSQAQYVPYEDWEWQNDDNEWLWEEDFDNEWSWEKVEPVTFDDMSWDQSPWDDFVEYDISDQQPWQGVGYAYGSMENHHVWQNPYNAPPKQDDWSWQYGSNDDWGWSQPTYAPQTKWEWKNKDTGSKNDWSQDEEEKDNGMKSWKTWVSEKNDNQNPKNPPPQTEKLSAPSKPMFETKSPASGHSSSTNREKLWEDVKDVLFDAWKSYYTGDRHNDWNYMYADEDQGDWDDLYEDLSASRRNLQDEEADQEQEQTVQQETQRTPAISEDMSILLLLGSLVIVWSAISVCGLCVCCAYKLYSSAKRHDELSMTLSLGMAPMQQPYSMQMTQLSQPYAPLATYPPAPNSQLPPVYNQMPQEV